MTRPALLLAAALLLLAPGCTQPGGGARVVRAGPSPERVYIDRLLPPADALGSGWRETGRAIRLRTRYGENEQVATGPEASDRLDTLAATVSTPGRIIAAVLYTQDATRNDTAEGDAVSEATGTAGGTAAAFAESAATTDGEASGTTDAAADSETEPAGAPLLVVRYDIAPFPALPFRSATDLPPSPAGGWRLGPDGIALAVPASEAAEQAPPPSATEAAPSPASPPPAHVFRKPAEGEAGQRDAAPAAAAESAGADNGAAASTSGSASASANGAKGETADAVQSPAAAKKTPDDSPPTAARDEAKESEESGAEGSSVAREVTREEAPVPPDAPELDFAAAPPPRLEAGEPDYFPSGRPQRVVLAVRGGRVVLEPAPEAPLERLEEAVRAIRARLAEAVAREEAFRKRVVRDRAATRSEASLRKADHPLLKTIERHLEGSRLNVVRQDF